MRTVIVILAAVILTLAGYLVAIRWWPAGQGSVVVTSDPPGAQVWVDLKPTSFVTDGKVPGLSRGKHSITVRLDTLMAEPFAQVVAIRRGRPDTVHFELYAPRDAAARRATEPAPTSEIAPNEEMSSTARAIPTGAEIRNAPAQTSGAQLADPTQEPHPKPPVVQRMPDEEPDKIPFVLPERPKDTSMASRTADVGTIEISSSEPGAVVFVNDHELEKRTPTSATVPFGTYTIRAELEGYAVQPDEQSVRISRASASQSVHFTLSRAADESREFTVQTSPVEGRIFVDGLFVGEGSAKVVRDYGTYVVTFGDVDGWRKPELMRMTLTPGKPKGQIQAKYTRLFQAWAQVNGDGTVTAEGITHSGVGVIFQRGKPQPSNSLGPKIKAIPDSKKYGWELGMGDPNHNPTGGDYVMFSCTLPEDVPPETPLSLRLYLYKSTKRYPFSLTGRAVMVVEINGRKFLDGFSPQNETTAADAGRYEEWSLSRVLRPGENQILVYTGEGNTVFEYLWRIEIQ